MENIYHRHGTWVGGSLSRVGFFFLWEKRKNFVGLGVKIRVSRVTGNQQLFFLGLRTLHHPALLCNKIILIII
jgi:hypothetical protein